ncbi:RNA polymerase sigma factor [Dehalobacterium formicoaceticum]|uniref:Sigma-70 family RNA polymerase sigma factor n=1 Tax=Dehalobacterium formicoaceticum TaxID=51515 RepID=A0ABT1Y7H8_9FIRM|nr:sigma-70 family RNA polymerase sigma factor [Dehalobacterium formicoaceticum]MCR6546844.1 sigma-70 family RNA polymerase sigma factor [Dehalobacterium formicoaceticum]
MKFFEKNQAYPKDKDQEKQFCSQISAYKLNMFRLAKSILRHDADAEDAVSEAIVKAYANLSSLRKWESFKPWIMRILVNESYNIANRRKKILYLDEMEIPEKAAEIEHQELWQVVQRLEEEFRIVTMLFYYEDLSLKEICRVLDLPMGTVKSRLSRARGKLREILDHEGSF